MSYNTISGDLIELEDKKVEDEFMYIDTDTSRRKECFEKFVKIKLLGRGAFANVYSSCNKKNTYDCKYVMKISDVSFAGEQKTYSREVKILKKLNNLNIRIAPYMHDNWVCTEEDKNKNKKYYGIILSEKMDCDLTNLTNMRINNITATNMIQQLIEKIRVLAEYGIYHKDLKPQNILLKDNDIFIGDFGVYEEFKTDKQNIDKYMNLMFSHVNHIIKYICNNVIN